MADKLMRTAVVMSFFLILALFSSCGTNDARLIGADNRQKTTLQSNDTLTPALESNVTKNPAGR